MKYKSYMPELWAIISSFIMMFELRINNIIWSLYCVLLALTRVSDFITDPDLHPCIFLSILSTSRQYLKFLVDFFFISLFNSFDRK